MTKLEIHEHENPHHGWGYAIKDEAGNVVIQFLNAHSDSRTDELKTSTRQIAEAEKQRIEKEGQV